MADFNYIECKPGVGHYSKAECGSCFFKLNGRLTNFQVKEFACKDGSDEVLVDYALVKALQDLRDRYGVTVINSAYRTPAYNQKIGGALKSQHIYGKASDTVCRSATPLEVAMTAEAWGLGGIGLYSSFTHIDTRDSKARWDQRSGKQVGVATFFKTIRLGSIGDYVRIAQRKLKLKDSGVFDLTMLNKVKEFQKNKHLDADGIIGKMTWTELMK